VAQRDPQPVDRGADEALLALERHGLGKVLLGPEFAVDPELVARAMSITPERPDLVALKTALGGDIAARLDELGFPAAERDTLTAPVPELRDDMTDAELWHALRGARPESVAVAGARGAQGAARRWLEDVRHRRLAIDGNDLVAAGLEGPAVGEALEAATVAMLEGRADTREEQLAAALRPSIGR
jgi:tRNA nucleotidyltransferase (CCA-adding enzyme)